MALIGALNRKLNFIVGVCAVAFTVAILLFGKWLNEAGHGAYWRFVHYHAHYLLLGALIAAATGAASWRKAGLILFNPMNTLRAEIWPGSISLLEGREERLRLWWHGMLNILTAFVLLGLRVWVFTRVWMPFDKGDIKMSMELPIGRLVDVALYNLVVGYARMFSYSVPDATNFVYLARTPADFWRRGVVYNYLFVFKFAYLPMLRLTRSIVVSQFFSLFAYWLSHYWSLILPYILISVGLIHDRQNPMHLKILLFHFLFSFIGLAFSSRIWFFSNAQMENTYRGWISIALNNVWRMGVWVLAVWCGRHLI